MNDEANREKLTIELANKIKQAIKNYTEYFTPHIFEDVFIVGGIRERGYSYHDIDIVLLWNFDAREPKKELEHIKRILEHIVHFWLKKQGFPIEKLDIYSFIRYGAYNLAYGGWNLGMNAKPDRHFKESIKLKVKSDKL